MSAPRPQSSGGDLCGAVRFVTKFPLLGSEQTENQA